MFVAAQAKRRRKYNTYVVFHGCGTWEPPGDVRSVSVTLFYFFL